MDVHGGTTEEDILGIFDEAEKLRTKTLREKKRKAGQVVIEEEENGEKELLSKDSSPVYVFLDEVFICFYLFYLLSIFDLDFF